jgi:choline dehydrogenase-like flavoprotein
MLLAAKILIAAGAKEVYPLMDGMGSLRSMAEAEACLSGSWPPGTLKLRAYHPMGTARLGRDRGGVVDASEFVRGTDRLTVTDASVFPTSLAVNPQITFMAFASRTADRILERW